MDNIEIFVFDLFSWIYLSVSTGDYNDIILNVVKFFNVMSYLYLNNGG